MVSAFSAAFYRMRQFFQLWRAEPLRAEELALAEKYLPRRALELFQTMPPGDQRHSLTIARELLARGYDAKPLLQAALLHDVAKARVGVFHRSGVIVMNALSPKLLPRAASENPRSWRFPFSASLRHPELGAQMAAHAGVDEGALVLIRRHQQPLMRTNGSELDAWQRVLKEIDDKN
jgi:hypothetical protein